MRRPAPRTIPDAVAIHAPVRAGDNIRLPGSDVGAGARPARSPAGPAMRRPSRSSRPPATPRSRVHRRPRVAVISTGDELVPPGEPLGPAQIHDSNSYALAAQAAEAGAEVRRLGVARDTLRRPARRSLREAVAWADVVVLSGGVSVGAHDHVKAAFGDIGDARRCGGSRSSPGARSPSPGRSLATAPSACSGCPATRSACSSRSSCSCAPSCACSPGTPRAFDRPVRIVRLAEPMRGVDGPP